jgi:acetyltransferase
VDIAVLMRPVCPTDTPGVRLLLAGLSAESSYRRFFTGLGRISDRLVSRLVDVDHDRRESLVAVVDATIVALADYAVLAACPDTIEIGVVVADAWQRRRIGPLLVGELLALAQRRGAARLRAHTLAENARIARLLRQRWPAARPEREDTLLVWDLPL